MNTTEKLLKAFEQFRPHINGHKTAMELFFEGIKEVKDLQEQVKKLPIHGVGVSLREIKEAALIALEKTKLPKNPKTTERELKLGRRAFINGAIWYKNESESK